MKICALCALRLFGVEMCWICGCADHVGLGNDREDEANDKPENDIIRR